MAKVKGKTSSEPKKMRTPITPEAQESQMISLAMDLVKQRLLDGTASSQETTHFLKLGSSKAVLERDKLLEENKLLRAKTEEIHQRQSNEELLKKALRAFRSYSGNGDMDDEEFDLEYDEY